MAVLKKIFKTANERKQFGKATAKLIAMPVLPLTLIKRPVLNAALANTKIKPMKPVVKLAIPGSFPTLLKQDAPDVL